MNDGRAPRSPASAIFRLSPYERREDEGEGFWRLDTAHRMNQPSSPFPCEREKRPKTCAYATFLSSDREGLRSVLWLRRGRQNSVEVLAVIVPLRRLHKDFCDVASGRAVRNLEKVQGDADVIGVAGVQEF